MDTTERALSDITRVLEAMEKGDLTVRIEKEYFGIFAALKASSNSTADKLIDIITRVNKSANIVLNAAEEIKDGNDDLNSRTEQQSSSLEETASSMEQMTSIIANSAQRASEASNDSKETAEFANQGGEVVEKAIGAMKEIGNASKKISDIIGVIDEIAFQTNLLALNAAVEAARAGEQGRGFAVVAGEVRNLAQRSSSAAKEIKGLINDSVEKVSAGSELVNESGETLLRIVESVQSVSNMIYDISDSANDQKDGIGQINAAVANMDQMTQQNAALVEQAAASSQLMADQARDMKDLISFFKVS